MITNILNTCEVVDGVTSAMAEFDLGKLAYSVRDMVCAHTDLEYINPTPSSVMVGHSPHMINEVLIW